MFVVMCCATDKQCWVNLCLTICEHQIYVAEQGTTKCHTNKNNKMLMVLQCSICPILIVCCNFPVNTRHMIGVYHEWYIYIVQEAERRQKMMKTAIFINVIARSKTIRQLNSQGRILCKMDDLQNSTNKQEKASSRHSYARTCGGFRNTVFVLCDLQPSLFSLTTAICPHVRL